MEISSCFCNKESTRRTVSLLTVIKSRQRSQLFISVLSEFLAVKSKAASINMKLYLVVILVLLVALQFESGSAFWFFKHFHHKKAESEEQQPHLFSRMLS